MVTAILLTWMKKLTNLYYWSIFKYKKILITAIFKYKKILVTAIWLILWILWILWRNSLTCLLQRNFKGFSKRLTYQKTSIEESILRNECTTLQMKKLNIIKLNKNISRSISPKRNLKGFCKRAMHRGRPLERTEEGSILRNESGPATTAAEREEGRRVKRIRVDLTRVSTLYWQAWLRVAGCKRASRDRWLVLFERNRLKDREAQREKLREIGRERDG